MLAGGKAKGGAGTSEAKSLLEIEFTPNYSVGQFSEVNLYWFSLPNAESSEVILTDPNGVVVFTSDKTGTNSEVFIADVIGTYTATITATSIPGGDAKTKEELLYVHEGKIPYVGTWSEADGTRKNSALDQLFLPDTGLNVDTKFSWTLSSASGPMSFLIEISDPDGKIVHSVSGDAVEEIGSHRHTTDILGEYTITATATNIVGAATHTDTILCKSWPPLVTDEVKWECIIPNTHYFYPNPDPDKIIADRKASKWKWWMERKDHYNWDPNGNYPLPDVRRPVPYGLYFSYDTGNATEAKIEVINPNGVVDWLQPLLPLTIFGDIGTQTFSTGANFWPSVRGMYTIRMTLSNGPGGDTAIFEHDIPFYEDLADKENNPDF
jgi:hypothetical protein